MSNSNEHNKLEIKYGELDLYYPLKLHITGSFEKKINFLTGKISRSIREKLKKCLKENEVGALRDDVVAFNIRAEFLRDDYEQAERLYGSVYVNSHERLLLWPVRIELSNGHQVWLQAVLYFFSNDMAILKMELPLVDVDNIPFKNNEWDNYIRKGTSAWCEDIELTNLEEIKEMYLSVISKLCNIEIVKYDNVLFHIILTDFEGCPYNVNTISDETLEELFKTLTGPFVDGPFTTYQEEAKEFMNKSSWGMHNVRCFLSPVGGCLSIVDKTVQDYWVNEHQKLKGDELNETEYITLFLTFVNRVQNSMDFSFVILMLKKLNVLEDIRIKSALKNKKGRRAEKKKRKAHKEYLENCIQISTIQEECAGTASEQIEEFERLMPHYTKKEMSKEKKEALNEIWKEKESEKEDKYQKFISSSGVILSLLFGLPAIKETIGILNTVLLEECNLITSMKDAVSVVLWLALNLWILAKTTVGSR